MGLNSFPRSLSKWMEPSPCTAHMKVGEGRGGEGVRLDPDGSGDSPAEAEGWSGRGGRDGAGRREMRGRLFEESWT